MKLSVALCTYNGVAYLADQLESIAAQTRRPDELVVCDDRSSDATVPTLRQFADRAPFPVLVHVNDINLGSTKNFEQAIGRCTGDVIFLCDQDDIWEPEKVARFESAFVASTKVGLVTSDMSVIGPDGNPLGRYAWDDLPGPTSDLTTIATRSGPSVWLKYNTVTGAATAFRADLRDIVLPIPKCWIHDAWIAFMAGAVSDVKLIRDPLTRYRTHPDQQIGIERKSLARQIRFARRMLTPVRLALLAECFVAAAERLSSFQDQLHDPGLPDMARGKAISTMTRKRFRERSLISRVVPAVKELFAGNYHRYGHGWKEFAADIFL